MQNSRILRSVFGRVSALLRRAPGRPRARGKHRSGRHGRCRKRPPPVLSRPRATAGAFIGSLERDLKLGAEVERERPAMQTVNGRLVAPPRLWDDPLKEADL